MNKSQLIKDVAKLSSFSKEEVNEILDLFLEKVVEYLCKGESVQLRGFGQFWVNHLVPRLSFKPPQKQIKGFLETKKVVFRPGDELRIRVNKPVEPLK